MTRNERMAVLAGIVLLAGLFGLVILLLTRPSMAPTPQLPTQAALPEAAAAVPSPSPTIPGIEEAAPTATIQPEPAAPVQNRRIIRFAPQTSRADREAYLATVNGTVTREIEALNAVVVQVPAAPTLPDSPVIVHSEPDYYVTALLDVPTSDTYFADQWGVQMIGAPDVWLTLPDATPGVNVAVIDSGVCATHPDLAGRIEAGYDFIEEDAVPQDAMGHGCAVTGVIAANIDNDEGIAGVAPNARIMPLRVLDADGIGTYSDVAAAIVYAVDHDAQVINLSLGGTDESDLLAEAVAYAAAHDVLVIAAAGNTGRAGVLYPAAYESVIAVGSIDPDRQISSFSSTGPQIALLAPGRDIVTTSSDGDYVTLSGTSLAAPHVTGAAVLEMARGRQLTLDGGIVTLGDEVIEQPTPLPVEVPPELEDLFAKAAAQGQVRVIVGLDLTVQPEGLLSSAQVQSQRANIVQAQQQLLGNLSSMNVQVLSQSDRWTIPALGLAVDQAALVYLMQSPEVTYIVEDLLMAPSLVDSVPKIDADDAWALGYDGTGQAIAILDTGTDSTHPFLDNGKVVHEACFSSALATVGGQSSSLCPGGSNTVPGAINNPGAAMPTLCSGVSGCEHGTHVAGIAAGQGGIWAAPDGVARGASVVAVQVFSRFNAELDCQFYAGRPAPCVLSYTTDQISALNHLKLIHDDLQAQSINLASINMSLGSGSFTSSCNGQIPSMTAVVSDLRTLGTATIAAAGNGAYNGSGQFVDGIAAPSCISDIVSVGSTISTTDAVSSFSQTATILDLMAPGEWIASSITDDNYAYSRGTSQASPHVAGAWAILRQARPDLTHAEILNALKSTGVGILDTRNGINRTIPRIDVDDALILIAPPTLVVNSTNDVSDGVCNETHCSLREAIIVANGTTGLRESIEFDIGAGGVQTIVLGTDPLPTITDPVTIDGTTQPGYSGAPLIEIDGTNVDAPDDADNIGLQITGGGSTVRGFVINHFGRSGIALYENGNNTITGNYLGIEPDGLTAAPNAYGIEICSSDDNQIGGTSALTRNVFSGNSWSGIQICQLSGDSSPSDNVIQGNYIGVDLTGNAPLNNGHSGIFMQDATNILIGGTISGAGNVISANGSNGITVVLSTGTTIQGNRIGPNAAGTQAFGDDSDQNGIFLGDSTDSLIGGTVSTARNLISGNSIGIYLDSASTTNTIQGNYIGTTLAGTAAMPNQNQLIGIQLTGSGEFQASNNLIGGTEAGAGNVISGNIGGAIHIYTDNNTIQGNMIGTDPTGTLEIGNGTDQSPTVFISGTGNMVGGTEANAGNVIAYSVDYGVAIGGTPVPNAPNNGVLGNQIYGTVAQSAGIFGLGIDIYTDGVTSNDSGDTNSAQNFPELTSAEASVNTFTVSGTLDSTPNTTFRVEFFSNDACDATGYGEGQYYLGAADVTTDGSGDAVFTENLFASVYAGQLITATATDPDNNTSEFSACEDVEVDPNILVVNTTSATNDGVCAAHCSLADAITVANNLDGVQTVLFNIPGSAPHTIRPTTALPAFGDLVIDATTQPTFAGSPIVVLDGSLLSIGSGLYMNSNAVIRGLVIHSFPSHGVNLIGNDNVVQGNYIGTDVTGNTAMPNGSNGVEAAGHDNLIGGTTAADRNVISGNDDYGIYIGGNAITSYANTIQGNYIGTNASGTAALGNDRYGIQIGHADNIIGGAEGTTSGGPCTGACNLISGNGRDGIRITDTTANPGVEADYNIIQGNYIGTDVTGTYAIANGESGIHLDKDTKHNQIGGPNPGEGNVISGNTQQGIEVNGDSETRQNTIDGNLIGTNAAGTSKVPNGQNGIYVVADATSITIGSETGGNLISGNGGAGIAINDARNHTIIGNNIGATLDGTIALGNTSHGISLTSAEDNLITVNLISGNGGSGVYITGESSDTNMVTGNLIGTNLAATAALANAGDGVHIRNGADSNNIGSLELPNIISGNTGSGVYLDNSITQNNVLIANAIGLNGAVDATLGNGQNGVDINGARQALLVGNLIGGNTGSGIVITNAQDTVIQANLIGMGTVDDSGGQGYVPQISLPNGQHGIWVKSGVRTTIGGTGEGEGNFIAFNSADGVYIESGTVHTIAANLIEGNGGLGIDLGANGVTNNDSGDSDSGANGLQNFPVIGTVAASVTNIQVTGTLNSAANTTYRLEFFNSDACDTSGYGEGRWLLDAVDVTTNASGTATFDQTFPLVVDSGSFVTMTATDPSGNTSEFSACAEAILYVATPQDLTATANTEVDIELSWIDVSIDETHWLIERSLAGQGSWTQIASLATTDEGGTGATVTYHDSTFLCSKSYDYRLRAYNENGDYYSLYTPVETATPTCADLLPPDNFALDVDPFTGQADLTWTDTNLTETAYWIEHSTNNGVSWKFVIAVAANSESHTFHVVVCGVNHSYRVRAARDHDGALSAYTPVQSGSTIDCSTPLPSNSITATPLSRSTMQLLWTDYMPGHTHSFHVERSTSGGPWTALPVSPANVTSIIDTNLNCGTNYAYRIRYQSQSGLFSEYSTVANATTSSCPAPVTHIVGLYKDGLWQFWDSTQNNQAVASFAFGPAEPGWTAVIGDWDGNGTDGIGAYKNGLWLLRDATGSGALDYAFVFGPAEPGWQPIVGDWDGDGRDGIGVYKDGIWLLRQTATKGQAQMSFNYGPAEPGWKAVAGDWDAGGTASVGLYKDGLWLLSNQLPAAADVAPFALGQPGWQPVVGDWNEDGRESAGIYKDGLWQLTNNSGSLDANFGFPIGSNWQPVAIYEGGISGLTMLAAGAAQPTLAPTTPAVTVTSTVAVAPTATDAASTEEPTVEGTEEPAAVTETATPTATPTWTATPSPTVTPVPPTATFTPTATATPTPLPPTDVPPEVTEPVSG